METNEDLELHAKHEETHDPQQDNDSAHGSTFSTEEPPASRFMPPAGYKHSAASSGYCTESEVYFPSSTTAYPRDNCTDEYFESRDKEVSSMLPPSSEEQETMAGESNSKTRLCVQPSSDSDVTHDLTFEAVNKLSASTHSLPALLSNRSRPLCSGHSHKELDNLKRYSNSSGRSPLGIDEEGYLHLDYRETDI